MVATSLIVASVSWKVASVSWKDDETPSIVPPKFFEWNILPASPMGSISCADFRLSPPVFSIFYDQGEGEGVGRPRKSDKLEQVTKSPTI